MKYSVAYLGFSDKMLQILSSQKDFKVVAAFCDTTRITMSYRQQCQKTECPCFCVEKSEEISRFLLNRSPVDFFVVYKTAIIVRQDLLDQYPFFNFHAGDLRTNKGAHPLVWNILLGEKQATLSLHQINAEIDRGILIGERSIPIFPKDDPNKLEVQLEKKIPDLLVELRKYLGKEISGKQVPPGGYRRRVRPEDYTIDAKEDSVEQACRKIDSQKPYFGAIFQQDGREIRIADYSRNSGEGIFWKGIWLIPKQ